MLSPLVRVVLVFLAGLLVGVASPAQTQGATTRPWPEVLAAARGQTVFWNAWAGDERTNAFISWAGAELKRRHGIQVVHVKLQDTAEAVQRVVAEKAAGRHSGGSVDLIWINGPNLLAMKTQGLLHGPVTQQLPNYRLVDTTRKKSNLVDFTVPVDGLAVPWRLAQFVFVHDGARYQKGELPTDALSFLTFAQRHPGRVTHPTVRNFIGATFLKQALHDLLPNPAVLQQPATDASFTSVTAPLWAWYDQLRPELWRKGREYPATGPAQRQMLNDGTLDLHMAFDPSEAAVGANSALLPAGARVHTWAKGMLGNTSFVAIPYNAAHKEAAMVLADFLLDPATQARGQALVWGGNLSVLDLGKLPAAQQAAFNPPAGQPALPTPEELGNPVLEPHPSWMTRLTAEFERRYGR